MEFQNDGIYFNKTNFGKCKIIAMVENNLLVKRNSEIEPYVVGAGFNFETKEWNWGHYFNDEKTAVEFFTENYINTYLQKYDFQRYKNEYELTESRMKQLKEDFREMTINDNRLLEYFKNDDPKDRFSSISFAGATLAGISIRNGMREAGNLDGEMEKSPYTQEQEQMIEKYIEMEKNLEKISDYAEMNCETDEEEMEF